MVRVFKEAMFFLNQIVNSLLLNNNFEKKWHINSVCCTVYGCLSVFNAFLKSKISISEISPMNAYNNT